MSPARMLFFISLTGAASCDTISTPELNQPVLSVVIVDENGTPTPVSSCVLAPGKCKIRGGRDRVVVHTSFENVDLEAQKTIAAPTMSVVLDGVVDSSPPTTSEASVSPIRSYVSGAWLAPPRAISDVAFGVKVNQGYEATFTGISVVAPQPSITMVGCSAAPCPAINDVGTANFVVQSWVPPDTLVHVTSIVDNVLTLISPDPTFHSAGDGPAEADLPAIPVPPAGVHWTILASVDDAPAANSLEIVLTPPAVTLAIQQCAADPCKLPAGSTASFVVGAPSDINTRTATIQFLVNGVSGSLPDVSLTLDPANASATGQFVVPTTSNTTLQLTAVIGKTGQAVAKATVN